MEGKHLGALLLENLWSDKVGKGGVGYQVSFREDVFSETQHNLVPTGRGVLGCTPPRFDYSHVDT